MGQGRQDARLPEVIALLVRPENDRFDSGEIHATPTSPLRQSEGP